LPRSPRLRRAARAALPAPPALPAGGAGWAARLGGRGPPSQSEGQVKPPAALPRPHPRRSAADPRAMPLPPTCPLHAATLIFINPLLFPPPPADEGQRDEPKAEAGFMEPFSPNPDFFSHPFPLPKLDCRLQTRSFPLSPFASSCCWVFFFPLLLFSQQDANPSAVEEIKHHKEKPN